MIYNAMFIAVVLYKRYKFVYIVHVHNLFKSTNVNYLTHEIN